MRNFLRLINRFGRDERGIFAVFFGILAVVLVATAGAVVDFTTVAQARTRAQDALDSAALGLQPRIYDDEVTEEELRAEAQTLLNERLASDNVTATVQTAEIDPDTGMLRFSATIGVPTAFVQLVGVNQIDAAVVSEVRRGALNIEVALALDVTASMGSATDPASRISAAKLAAAALVETIVQDDQTPNYSKMALIPWSSAVNVGSLADSVRGGVTGSTSITGAGWLAGTIENRIISAISKASPALITTTAAHGLSTGAVVYLSGISGGGFPTALNNRWYQVTVVSTTQFSLNSTNTSLVTGTYTSNSGAVNINSTARLIGAITKASDTKFTTTTNHGLVVGDGFYVTGVAGGDFTALNNRWFTVKAVNSTTEFTIEQSTNSYDGTYTANTGGIRKCLTSECEVVITSVAHELDNDEYVYLTTSTYLANVGGHLNIDNSTTDNDYIWQVTDTTDDTYVLENSVGPSMGAYASGGQSWCTRQGCEYYYFNSKDNSPDYSLHRITTCVTERVAANQYTDVAPSTTPTGRQYTASPSDCLTPQIIPLTATKSTLTTAITNLTTTGTTAGQVGTAWGWYMLAPNFAYLFTGDGQQPAAYDAPHTKKIAIIMTDGEYNTPYCNGVVANDHGAPTFYLPDSRAINCNATNGSPLTQAAAVCTAMKAAPANIKVYTVGFQLGADTGVISMLTNCASSPSDAYLADNATELMDAFQEIGNDISDLRLAQ